MFCLPRRDSRRNCDGGCSGVLKNIIDTGPLVYRFDKSESSIARWSRRLFRHHEPPFYTCEAVLTEAAYMTSPELIARLVKDA